jgi:hypothetical protein
VSSETIFIREEVEDMLSGKVDTAGNIKKDTPLFGKAGPVVDLKLVGDILRSTLLK